MLSTIFLNTERETRNIWWVAIFFIILSLFLFPLIIVSDRYGFELSISLQAVLIIVITVICQIVRRKPQSDWIGNIDGQWFKQLLIGLIIGAGLMLLPALLLTVFGYIQWQVNDFLFSTLASGMASMFAVAIAEELLFRGFIFQRFIGAFGKWPAQLIIASLFLLTHLNNPGMTGTIKVLASINIFIASIMFGLAYIKTKRLAMPLGLHFMANLMQGAVLGFGVSGEKGSSLFTPTFNKAPIWISGGEFGIEASIFGLLILLLVTISLFFWKIADPKNF